MKRLPTVAVILVLLASCSYDGGLSQRMEACKAKGMVVKSAKWDSAWGWEVTCVMPETR